MHHARQHQRELDEGHITHHQVKAFQRIGDSLVTGLQLAGVHAFDANHTLVLADARVHLGMAHINAHHFGRAVLQQTVGEPPRALTHIKAAQAVPCTPVAFKAPSSFKPPRET